MRFSEGKDSRKYAVSSKEIKPYLQQWIDRGHPLNVIAWSANTTEPTLVGIINGKTKYTTGAVAERIEVALQIGLGNESIKFTYVPNPLWGYPPETSNCEEP